MKKIGVKTLKAKIIATLLLVSIIAVLFTGISSYYVARSKLSEVMGISRQQVLRESTRGIDNYYKSISNIVKLLSTDSNIIHGDSLVYFQLAKDLMANVKDTEENILNVFYGVETGSFYINPIPLLEKDFDFKDREWYKNAKENPGQVVMSGPYVDTVSGKLVISLSTSVEDEEEFIGVVGIDMQLNTLVNLISDYEEGDSGYTFIIDPTGIVISHPNGQYIGSTSFASSLSIWEEAMTNESGEDEANVGSERGFVNYVTSTTTGWKVFAFTDRSELDNRTNSVLFANLGTILGAIAISFIGAILFSNPIAKNIKLLLKGFKIFSEGDMTVRLEIDSKDEFEVIGQHFNEMAQRLSGVMRKVSDSSTIVLHNAGALTDMAQETNHAIGEVARAIEEVANGTSEQASNASEGAYSISELADELTMIVKATDEMSFLSQATDVCAKEGLDYVRNLSDKSDSTMDSTMKVSSLVYETSESMHQINQISNTIDGITEQTNLLALNASIEAARAGESGRGFGVVANEIRKLADQSRSSTLQIKEIIDNIIQKTDLSVAAMEETKQNVSEQVDLVHQTRVVFQEIMESIAVLAKQVEKVKNNTEKITVKKEEVVGQIENISAISEEAASATEEVTASTEEISVTMDEIATYTVKLTKLSEELQQSVNTFKLK